MAFAYPWLPSHLRGLYDFLRFQESTWGFTIYRTTYTQQSDAAFPQIIDLITSYIKYKFYREFSDLQERNPDKVDKTVFDELWACYRPRIIDDTQFNDASIDFLRSHFESWVEKRNMRDRFPSYRMFIVIDEESFQTLLDAPNAEESVAWQRTNHFVKVIEAWPDNDPPFEGWMKCSLSGLWDLWPVMQDGDYMRMSYMMMRGVRDVY
ncbi:hypothetical protein BDV23DRAFT_144346 [Aspergillus alliaceus]|uniref:Uncharacterized protein n=1 Tax=Petromyces alliaceus TaxID=209559 RepID=A0A5N7CQC8_PETAA|nr:hypothetical protein BDV23DRAFT_144346 [Aspergillus alliaceus]